MIFVTVCKSVCIFLEVFLSSNFNVFVRVITEYTDIIQLLVFKETNFKVYWCGKGDIDRYSSNTNYCFITFLCQGFGYYCQMTAILIKFFSILNERHAVTSQQTFDVMSLDWDEHNISCCGTISLFIWSHVICSRPIRDQELGRKSNNLRY